MSPLEDAGLQDFRHRCGTCMQQPPAYLVVWPAQDDNRLHAYECDFCFKANIVETARHAEAIYHLPTCAQVRLTIRNGFGEVLE